MCISRREEAIRDLFQLWGLYYMSNDTRDKVYVLQQQEKYIESGIIDEEDAAEVWDIAYSDNFEAYAGGLTGFDEDALLEDVLLRA